MQFLLIKALCYRGELRRPGVGSVHMNRDRHYLQHGHYYVTFEERETQNFKELSQDHSS